MSSATNKVITITGASSGIGEASAKLLAKNGAKVVLGARRIQKLVKIVEEICDRGGIAEYKAWDVCDRENVENFIHFTKEKFRSPYWCSLLRYQICGMGNFGRTTSGVV